MAGSRAETKTGGRPASQGVIPGDFALSVGKPERQPPSGWSWTPLTDVARLESGHTPSRKHPEYWEGDVPWIGIKDATENHGRVLQDTLQHTNALGIANSSARILPRNTVCLSRTASVGYVVVMGKPMATSQDFVNWVCSDAIDYQYLKYVLLSERAAFLRFASGTTHQTIYFPEVKAFHVCLPPVSEQRAIANILGALDDKLELNRRRNQTLESVARALFKDWFVDFGPVRAKMGGHEPYLPADLWQSFPEELDDEGKPEGWRVVTLADLVDTERGLSYKGAGLTGYGSGEPMHNLNSVLEGGGYKYSGIKYYCAGYKERHIAKGGDIVVANTEQGHKHLLIGFPAIIPASFSTGLFSHHLYRVRLRPHVQATKYWLYYMLMAPEVREQVIGHANGSTVNMLKQSGLQAPRVVLPSLGICQRFEKFAESIHARIECNVAENDLLIQIRDTLLPKLISGELRIQNAERFLETSP